MPVNSEQYEQIIQKLREYNATLVAVSKVRSNAEILDLYNRGQRHFGENYVQELLEKQTALPRDIQWHFIGHLQSNKVKYLAPFISLIQGVDSLKLLKEIEKQGMRWKRTIPVLLQVHIAEEETKFGMNEEELAEVLAQTFSHVHIRGLMGMASNTDDEKKITVEFRKLKGLFDQFNKDWDTLSMGMSGDYLIALNEGSNMVRIGSLLFGPRK